VLRTQYNMMFYENQHSTVTVNFKNIVKWYIMQWFQYAIDFLIH